MFKGLPSKIASKTTVAKNEALFNAYFWFYPTVLGLRFMRSSEVKKNVTLKNEPPKNEPYKIYDRFTSPDLNVQLIFSIFHEF